MTFIYLHIRIVNIESAINTACIILLLWQFLHVGSCFLLFLQVVRVSNLKVIQAVQLAATVVLLKTILIGFILFVKLTSEYYCLLTYSCVSASVSIKCKCGSQ